MLTSERLREWIDELERCHRPQSDMFGTKPARPEILHWNRILDDMREVWRDMLAKEVA